MRRVFTALLGSAFLLAALPVSAHHGRGATYANREIQIKGVVKQVLWRNPHIGIVIDAPDANGQIVSWHIEHSNVSTLSRLGYGRQSLQAGWQVTAVINPGAKGEPIGLCRKIILADGKEIFIRGANTDPLD